MSKERITQAWKWQHEAMKQSEYVQGEKVFDKKNSYVDCPRCASKLPWLEHGETHVCGSCQLSITLWGASFEVS